MRALRSTLVVLALAAVAAPAGAQDTATPMPQGDTATAMPQGDTATPMPQGDTATPVAQAQPEPGASASAEVAADVGVEAGADEAGPLVLGAEIGALFPQPFTELGTHVALGLEVGFRLPFAGRRLEVMLDAGYAPPTNSVSMTRPDGTYEGELDQLELHFSLGPRFRFMDARSPWNVSLAAGARLFLLRTYSNGSKGGQPFAEYTEESTQVGFFVALGGEYRVGPGALLLDIDLGWSSLPHRITGDASTGNIATTIGYRFFLL